MKNNLTPLVLSHDPVWAIEEVRGRFLWQQLSLINVDVHRAEYEASKVAEADAPTPEVEARNDGDQSKYKPFDYQGGVAIISIAGPMMKSPSSFSSSVSTVYTRRLIRAAVADPDVKSILIRFDSPGGSVSGTSDLADDIESANTKKECVAYIEDCCCSAAYWAASQCSSIYGNRTAIVGSIGTYMVVEDWSKFYQDQGIDVHVLSTGKFKGAGVEGSEITIEQLAHFQETVDALNEHFLSAVAKGRGMSRAKLAEYADGRTWTGQEAVSIGLMDGVSKWDDVLLSMQKGTGKKPVSAQENVFASEAPLRIDGPLGIALDSVLIAVRGSSEMVATVSPRVETVVSIRQDQGRVFSPERLAQVREATEALVELAGSMTALLASCEALGHDEPVSTTEAEDQPEPEPATESQADPDFTALDEEAALAALALA
jgi:signal peptide peptidase SppA